MAALALLAPIPAGAHEFELWGYSMPVTSDGEVAHYEVTYADGQFEPARLEVKLGDHVMFINLSDDYVWPASNIHPTHEIYPGFDPEMGLGPGQSWTMVFDQPGDWRYHNHLQPDEGGTVLVTGTQEAAIVLTETVDPESLTFAPMAPLTPEEALILFGDDAALREAIETYGPSAVVGELSRTGDVLGINCHQRAHTLGRLAYNLYGATAFSLSAHQCQSGSYHGATEAMFRERGTSDLAKDVQAICSDTTNVFFRFQCIHGIGHGLMAWTNYELVEALDICESLKDTLRGRADITSCYSGVFMENVVGGLSGAMGHYTRYLSGADHHYPCNILEGEGRVKSCYFYHTSHMIKLFRNDFRTLAVACSEAPEFAQPQCFQSMGRDVGQQTRGYPDQAIERCYYILDRAYQLDCIEGAVQDWFWEASGADIALSFCHTLIGSDAKERCYITIMRRAKNILQPDELTAFCNQVEPGYHVRIPVTQLIGRALSSLNPWGDENGNASGYEACRRALPQFHLLVERVSTWFST